MKRLLGNISAAVMILLLFHSAAHAYNLPDTGQAKCYEIIFPYAEIPCSSTGQDGEYDINPMSYTDNGNGTVTDNNTGLMWQKCSAGQTNFTDCSGGTAATYNWYQATGTPDSTYNPSGGTKICGALNTSNFGGQTDWRLPTDQELQTIVDYSIPSPGPAIRTAYFPNTIASVYWSSTTDADYPSYAWDVYFSYGVVSYDIKDGTYYVRCVRGGQPAQSFTNNGNGTVTDNKTGLVWQKCSAGQTNDPTCSGSLSTDTWWNDALIYCKTPQLGYADWRLPNAKELRSLVDSSRYNPSINPTYFPNADVSYCWSSTTYAGHPANAWFVEFNDGVVDNSGKSNTLSVRCVRGGQGEASYVRLMRADTPINTFNNIQDAYNNAEAGDVIQAKDLVSTENQTFVATKTVSVKGGYDSGFTSNSGFTTINGNMTIIGGAVTIENVIIK